MRLKLLIVFILLALLACSDDSNNPTYPFERTVSDVSIVKRCKDGSFAPGANCYIMRWQHPIEQKDLQSYYVWIDTTVVKDSVEKASQTQIDQATAVIPYSNRGDGDSLDLTDLISEFLARDSLHIAIWAKYSGNEQGVVRHLHVHFGDDVQPSIVSFSDSASANTIWINWVRPTDQRDFYLPDNINGPIAGYNISIGTDDAIGSLTINLSLAGYSASSSLRRNQQFRKDGRGVKLEDVTVNDPRYLRLAVIDGNGFVNDDTLANKWRMEISGLKPERSYSITIAAYDSSGNPSSGESRIIKTTDNIAPTKVTEFIYNKDSAGNAILDSNRLILSWIPSEDLSGIASYLLQILNDDGTWGEIPRASAIRSGYYAPSEGYVRDTLRWVLPGETFTLRLRAIDNSGHYSNPLIETIAISKGELWRNEDMCPPDFAPVKMADTVFCMEKLQRNSNGKFERNILYIEAKSNCETRGYRLCSENEWNAACNSGGASYGIIEEKNEFGIFSPSEFLFMYCGVGTGDSLSAINVNRRNKICASPDGIRDLPGQLQEWVIGRGDSAIIKGSSYPIFEGASRVELAQCRNRFTPTRIRPRYTTEAVYLYRVGSRMDTLLARDPARDSIREPTILTPDSFLDTLLFYALKKSDAGNVLGQDYVNQAEYRKRGGDKWLDVLWQGLIYEQTEKRQVLIVGDTAINASSFFLDPTVGFRCCTNSNDFSILSP
ncbi:MAG: hypothetical protein FWB90_05890 [Fibromonadales bacterium]|nr:hypothetical protein [Fibromonadales bacterium]MCL2207612.1 hypothetical protein [Fibromonadales bacterium]